jgi:hypothetical protein
MRATFTSLAILATAMAANAQFSLTPKAGLEPTRTSINYNDLRCLSPLGSKINPQIGLRLDYKFKKTHGPYIGVSTNRSIVVMQFSNPETGVNNYTASAGDRQVRFEGGYTYSSKPISLGSTSSGPSTGSGYKATAKESPAKSEAKHGCCRSAQKSSCGSRSKSHEKLMAKNKGWTMRIQPSAGLAYNPAAKTNLIQEGGGNFQYNAGNWKTALTAGTDLEFGRGRDRVFTVGFQYLKGLGNSNASITTQTGTKATTTYLSSRSSAYNITLGVPFTVSKQQRSRHKDHNSYRSREKKQCIYYRPCRRA